MDYAKIANSVAKKIASYGMMVVLRQSGPSAYDNNTLKTVPGPVVDEARKALVTEQPGTRIGPQYGTSSQMLVVKAQKWIYMDAFGLKPVPNDKVLIDDVPYNVVDVQETAPGGIVVYYLVVLMR